MMTTSRVFGVFACFLALAANVCNGITCYRGINIQMPGAYFNQTMNSLGCNNADYCVRGFGTFNGQEGWYSSCVERQKKDVTCKGYPECQEITKGNSSYTTCCCKEALCNHLDFTGETKVTTTAPIISTTNNEATTKSATIAISLALLIRCFI